MHCPYCSSTRVRKASAVYEEGTSIIKTRTRGVGIGAGRAGLGVGGFTGRSRGRSSSLAARRADKVRPVWIGPKAALILFVILCIVLANNDLDNPFGKALALTIGIVIICPAVIAIVAAKDNRNYDRRWFCDACGEIWTRPAATGGLG